MKKNILSGKVLLFLCIVFSLFCGLASASNDDIQIFFGPNSPKEFGIANHFIAYVDAAKTTLDMAFYEIRLDLIVTALINAKKRGVKVRIVVDNDNYYFDPTKPITAKLPVEEGETAGTSVASGALNPFVKALIDAGIEVKDDCGRSALMHNKFAIRDSSCVWTGSYNLTDTCSYINANSAIQINSVELSKVYSAKFEEMFTKRIFGAKATKRDTTQTFQVGDTKMELFFAPEDNPSGRVAEILKNAKSEIYFMQFAFTDDGLSDILVQKHKSGVVVKGIFDRILYRSTGPFGEFAKLSEAEVPVLIYTKDGKFHHKVFIVDPNGQEPIVVMGSENASKNGNSTNDENVLILHSKSAAQAYFKTFSEYFSKTISLAAEINYADFPFSGSTIDDLDLTLFSNGRKIQELNIDFPARWKTASQTIGDIRIFRNDKDTTKNEKLVINSRGIQLKDAQIPSYGPNSWIQIQFLNVHLPSVAGKYAFLCSASLESEPGKFYPMQPDPVITVLDKESDKNFNDLLSFIRKANQSLDEVENRLAPQEIKLREEKLTNLNLKMSHLLCEAAKNGNYKRVEDGIIFAEGFSPQYLKYSFQITNNFSDLRSILKNNLSQKENDIAKAKELLERIDQLAKKTGAR
ncbi:MAG: hypothetical protein HQM08_15130 [Candidatus Riflebacteria bacterium]|nr:hypothetical protein [Candidatus Riflebacteria bacterium]